MASKKVYLTDLFNTLKKLGRTKLHVSENSHHNEKERKYGKSARRR